ncbi:MAG: ATP-binding protein, partial [Pseudobdellovibrionaceae bacterium]|nr:ATP-binding protein [Pseudobdellovibrionaceae bacterium]
YYERRHWRFHASKCDGQLNRIKMKRAEKNFTQRHPSIHATGLSRQAGQIRQQFEVQALLEIFLKLSAIKKTQALYEALTDSLCHSTGSEFAILFFQDSGKWVPKFGRNISLAMSEGLARTVDWRFIERQTEQKLENAIIRSIDDGTVPGAPNGSVMLIPLVYEGVVHGFSYLANSQIVELFDVRSLEIAGPIAAQGAIALQNILLKDELAVERDQVTELNQTLEQRVAEQTRDIKSIMKHIQIGICTISGEAMLINRDYSSSLEQILGTRSLAERSLLSLILPSSQLNTDEQDQVKNVLLASLGEGDLAFVANEHLLPRMLIHKAADMNQERYLEMSWSSIVNEEGLTEKVLVTMSDVTSIRQLEQTAAVKDRELKMISEILRCSEPEWQRFIDSTHALLRHSEQVMLSVTDPESMESAYKAIFMDLHTVKGHARSLKLKELTEALHQVEQRFAASLKGTAVALTLSEGADGLRFVTKTFAEYEDIGTQKLGRSAEKVQKVSIDYEEALDILRTLQQGKDAVDRQRTDKIQETLQKSLFQDGHSLFHDIFAKSHLLAYELGKEAPVFSYDLPDFYVGKEADSLIRNCFIHLLRNALDHGIETAGERHEKGKNPRASISISARFLAGMFEIRFGDDGRGLNLRRLRELALDKGLTPPGGLGSDEQIAELIFLPQMSTSAQVTEISGRGVGMGAVRQYLHEAGGTIFIQFKDESQVQPGFRSFSFVICLPATHFQQLDSRSAA